MAKFYAPLKLSENIRSTPEGFLLCLNVPIARTGWQEYGQGETPLEAGEDGLVRVYRSPEEVFREKTIASFEGKAVTIRHPEQFVGPENWSSLAKGSVQNVRRSKDVDEDGEESLLADLLITDDFAIKLVKNGLREVSCGYEAEYSQTEAGKGIQTNIVGNHLALVEEGRAGPAYAINDERRAADMDNKTLIERLKAKLGAKVVDEAMAEPKKDEKAKDAEMKGYDELAKMVKDLCEKVDGFMKAKDEDKADKKDEPAKDEDKPAEKKAGDEEEKKEEKAKDEGEEPEILERIKALEVAVAKLLDMEKAEAEAGDEGEEKKESEDEESEEAEDEEKESSVVGDEARAEILAPGLKVSKKQDLKVEALKAAYKTGDGKEVIDTLSNGKAPSFDAKSCDALFIAASELLKAKRGSGLAETKDGKKFKGVDSGVEVMTADKMNEINAAHWGQKK